MRCIPRALFNACAGTPPNIAETSMLASRTTRTVDLLANILERGECLLPGDTGRLQDGAHFKKNGLDGPGRDRCHEGDRTASAGDDDIIIAAEISTGVHLEISHGRRLHDENCTTTVTTLLKYLLVAASATMQKRARMADRTWHKDVSPKRE